MLSLETLPVCLCQRRKHQLWLIEAKAWIYFSKAALLEAAQLKKTLKKSKLKTHKLHASGLGDRVGSQPKVPDESKDKTTGTNEGNDDDSHNDDSDDASDDDDVDSDAGSDNEAKLYKDINVRLKDAEHEEEGKGDAEMTNVGCNDGTQQTTYEQFKDEEHVRHEDPCSITPFPQQSTPTQTLTRTTETTTTSIHALLDFSSLFRFDQRVSVLEKELSQLKQAFKSYTIEFEKKAKDERKRYIEKPPLTFDEQMSTPIDFSRYVINNLMIDNLTQENLVGPSFNILKGTCRSRVELEYHFKECYKAITDRLDWNNPEEQEYPFDHIKPLLLIEDRGSKVVLVNYFINNDLEYLKGGSSSRKYTTSTTKTKAAKYDDIQGIEDMVTSVSKHDVFSTKRIIIVTHVKVMKWYDYEYLEDIEVRREDQQLYTFREGDFPRLNLCDIEDMLLLLVKKKLFNIERDVIFDLNVELGIFTRRVVILKRVEDLHLGVKSYQKKLEITRPKTFKSEISKRTPYTAYINPQGIIYADKFKINGMDYLPKRRWSTLDKQMSRIMIKAIDKLQLEIRLMRNLEMFVGGREYGEDFRLLVQII
nr:hypothetical protein [Tanacetum cinerariifolium]